MVVLVENIYTVGLNRLNKSLFNRVGGRGWGAAAPLGLGGNISALIERASQN